MILCRVLYSLCIPQKPQPKYWGVLCGGHCSTNSPELDNHTVQTRIGICCKLKNYILSVTHKAINRTCNGLVNLQGCNKQTTLAATEAHYYSWRTLHKRAFIKSTKQDHQNHLTSLLEQSLNMELLQKTHYNEKYEILLCPKYMLQHVATLVWFIILLQSKRGKKGCGWIVNMLIKL